MIKSDEQEPSQDEAAGMAWWNALDEESRSAWITKVGTAVVADAWAEYKHSGDTKIHVNLAPDFLRVSMQMWRETIDFKIPIHDDFKLHFLSQRSTLLAGFQKVASNWLTVLRACTPVDDPNRVAFDGLVAEVTEFKVWAESESEKLRAIGTEG